MLIRYMRRMTSRVPFIVIIKILIITIIAIIIIINMLIRYMRKMTSIMDSLKPVARIYWEVEEKVTKTRELKKQKHILQFEEKFTFEKTKLNL